MEQNAFLWPRMFALVRAGETLPTGIVRALEVDGIECTRVNDRQLLADISYLQNEHRSTASAVAGFQHLLNRQLSPFSYALGIGSEAVAAYYAASVIGPGQEKWLLPWQCREQLDVMPVSVLQVMDTRMPGFFRACHKTRCGELREFGKDFLMQRFGYAGQALWYLLRGKSQQVPLQRLQNSETFSWQLPLPVRTLSQRALSAHAWRLYSLVNRNLAHLNRQAGQLELQCRTGASAGRAVPPVRLNPVLKQKHELGPYLEQLIVNQAGVTHLQITASRLFHPAGQMELFQ